MLSGSRSDIEDIIGSLHDIFVMFDDDDTISDRDELLDILYKHSIVSRMQSDRWFIEDIRNPLEFCSDLCGEAYTLRFSSGYGSSSSRHRHIIEPYSGEELETLDDILHDTLCDGFFGY